MALLNHVLHIYLQVERLKAGLNQVTGGVCLAGSNHAFHEVVELL